MTTQDVAAVDAERQALLEHPSGLASSASQPEAAHSSKNETSKARTVSLVIQFTLALTGEDFRYNGVNQGTWCWN